MSAMTATERGRKFREKSKKEGVAPEKSIRLGKEMASIVEDLAEKSGKSKSEVVRGLVRKSLSDLVEDEKLESVNNYFSIPSKESRQLDKFAKVHSTTREILIGSIIEGQLKNLNNVENLMNSGSTFSPEEANSVRRKTLGFIRAGFGANEVNGLMMASLKDIFDRKHFSTDIEAPNESSKEGSE